MDKQSALMVVHHHVLAFEYLLEQLATKGENREFTRLKAFTHAHYQETHMPPEELQAICEHNLAVIQAIVAAQIKPPL